MIRAVERELRRVLRPFARRALPAGPLLLVELERLGHPCGAKLGVRSRETWRAVAQVALWTGMWSYVICSGALPGFPRDAVLGAWLVGVVTMGGGWIVMRLRSRVTIRAAGLELESGPLRLVPWSAIQAARLDRGDLVVEYDVDGRTRTLRSYVGEGERWIGSK